MQFSKERVSIFTQFSGHHSIGLILPDFTAGVVHSALPLGIAKIAFQFFLQMNGIYSKSEMDRGENSSRSKSSQEDPKHENAWFSQMRNLGTITENCLSPSLLWIENDTIVHNDSTSLLTDIIQGISQSWKGKEKGECDKEKKLQTAVKTTATYHCTTAVWCGCHTVCNLQSANYKRSYFYSLHIPQSYRNITYIHLISCPPQ